MISEYKIRELRWLDVVAPTKEELKDLEERFNIDEQTLFGYLSKNDKDNISIINKSVFISLPFIGSTGKSLTSETMLFAINDKYIISIHEYDFQFVQEFTHSVSANKLIKTTDISYHPLNIFLASMNAFYDEIDGMFQKNTNKISKLESVLVKNSFKHSMYSIFLINNDISTTKSTLSLQSDVIGVVSKSFDDLFGEKADEICDSISIRISNLMNKAEDIFSSLSNLKQKSIILEQRRQKVYQARMVLLGLVLLLGGIIATVLVGISDIEQTGHKYGFFAGFALIVIGVISIITALIKRKKWL